MKEFKFWLDDIRPAPDGWVWIKTAEELIDLIKSIPWSDIKAISFDHDLGTDKKSGYDVLTFIEKEVYSDNVSHLPTLSVHSQNPVGILNMIGAIRSIHRKYDAKK